MRYKSAMSTGTSDAQLDRRSSLLSIVGFWALYFLLNTLRWAIEGAPDLFSGMGRRAAVCLFGMGFVFIVSLVLRRFEHRSMRVLITVAFLASIPTALAYASVNYVAFYVVHPSEHVLEELAAKSASEHYGLWAAIEDSATGWYFFIASWAVLHVALMYAARVRHAERSAARYRSEAQAAQLRALRYQINPHFLFNTLNALSTLVLRERTDEAERMIANLAAFFRQSLSGDPTEDVPLAEEIRMQQLYLEIEKVRFPDRLLARFEIGHEAEAALVPGLILQPLVENAIKYGVSRSSRPVTVAIRAHGEADRLYLSVEDDGAAEGPPSTEANGHGVGLKNVADRLAARFDGSAECRYGPRPDGGFRVDLVLPLRPA